MEFESVHCRHGRAFCAWTLALLTAAINCIGAEAATNSAAISGRARNPVFDGWYADPEGAIFGREYWIYPTYSAPYGLQVFFDAFSSPDLVTWTKRSRILDTNAITWARRAMWAPAVIEKDRRFYFFFSAAIRRVLG